MRTIPAIAANFADALDRLRSAAAFLTRLPVAPNGDPSQGFLGRACVAFPLIGAGIGVIGGGIYAFATAIGLPPLASAFLALTAIVVLTGALHEDGLADVCDGIGGGRNAPDRLRIMRDSHNGTFGTLSLVLSVGVRAALLAALAAPGPVMAAFVAAGAVSRGVLPAVMGLMGPARVDGLAAAAGRPTGPEMLVALALAFVIAWITLGFAGAFLALVLAAGATGALAFLARRALGGHTGDVLGACQQAGEIAVLAVAAVMAGP